MTFGSWGNTDHAGCARIIPGTNVNGGDAGWTSPALDKTARRRA